MMLRIATIALLLMSQASFAAASAEAVQTSKNLTQKVLLGKTAFQFASMLKATTQGHSLISNSNNACDTAFDKELINTMNQYDTLLDKVDESKDFSRLFNDTDDIAYEFAADHRAVINPKDTVAAMNFLKEGNKNEFITTLTEKIRESLNGGSDELWLTKTLKDEDLSTFIKGLKASITTVQTAGAGKSGAGLVDLALLSLALAALNQ